MTTTVLSYNQLVTPLSPHDHDLLPKTTTPSSFLGSVKRKSATTTADDIKPPSESYQTDEKYNVSDGGNMEKTREPRPFLRRKWMPLDILRVSFLCLAHSFCLYAPFCFSWHVFMVSAALALITGMFGLTTSYHRQLSHNSFTTPKWLEYTFAYCGVQAFEGSPIDWVSTHRYHHKYSDTQQDPHSPNIEGFLFSHVTWVLDRQHLTAKCGKQTNVDDLRSQAYYRFLEKTYYLHPLGFGVLLYNYGGLPMLIWAMGVRVVFIFHVTLLLSSACHIWGKQVWKTGDLSRNNWIVALLAYGDGWHNNHHAFQYSARHGIEWWELDVTWGFIRFLEIIGLATNVKRPTEAHKKRRALPNTNDAMAAMQN